MHTNRLINEKSPYLLQHAHNPVDWYAWGEEAFRKAREEDKPIFLSVGYSTCHWCHVMERESFENDSIAELLNRYFVPIKVDREERPDVDRIYMLFVQASTGSGGWPMSVFLTPDLKPFFGGTYFPPERRHGRPGFAEVLERIAEAWRVDRRRITLSGRDTLEQLSRQAVTAPVAAPLDPQILDSGFNTFRRSFDGEHGGFGGAPKFPRTSVHNFLLRYYRRTGKVEALEMVFASLNGMAHGGINDHLGGGFHRYSVDERWFVPHFEKMLYDQAQIAISYLEAYQVSSDHYYAAVARAILDYVLRDMTHPDGGFYSAEDADSAGDPALPDIKSEGAFYLWTKDEIDAALGSASDWFCHHYGVQDRGNVFNDPHGEFAGRNILFEAHPIDDTARRFGVERAAMDRSLAESRKKLLERRARRLRPGLDDKVLTSWNGLMISAFAKGAQVLDDERYLGAARRATAFILDRMYDDTAGTLLRRFRSGDAAIGGFLDDYAFFVQALLDLYETDFDPGDLEYAVRLTDRQIEWFEDRDEGGFFSTGPDDESIILRLKDDYDGAEPSGNSITISNLLRLAEMSGREDYREAAMRTLRGMGARAASVPEAVPQMLASIEHALARPKQIVLVGPREDSRMRQFVRAVNSRFLPNKVVLMVDDEDARHVLARYQPAIASMHTIGGSATAYVCENFTCQLPATDIETLTAQLER